MAVVVPMKGLVRIGRLKGFVIVQHTESLTVCLYGLINLEIMALSEIAEKQQKVTIVAYDFKV